MRTEGEGGGERGNVRAREPMWRFGAAVLLLLLWSRSACAFTRNTITPTSPGLPISSSSGGGGGGGGRRRRSISRRPWLLPTPKETRHVALSPQMRGQKGPLPPGQQQHRHRHRHRVPFNHLAPFIAASRTSTLRHGTSPSAASASATGGERAPKTQSIVTVVQKWCDRTTSLFPAWVLGAAALGMFRPAALAWFNDTFITAALATTMVCMGMTLTLEDFKAVARRPKPVMAGVAAQYTVMPLLGYLSGRLFNLPPALAAGVTLVGCCPGGTASNLVTLIANGDVALSVSMTTVSTLLAAAVTGPLTKFLVGALVDISAATLMRTTAQVVFLPVALGLLLNTRAKGFTRRLAPYTPLLCVALVAMICGSVVAANSSILAGSGAALIGAVLTLHAGGFAIGYGGMRACGFPEQVARTTSIEVGMQNSALAVVLAQRGLADPASAVPGAVSATCHSLIGSALAAYWRTGDRGVQSPSLAAEAAAGAGVAGEQEADEADVYDAGGGI